MRNDEYQVNRVNNFPLRKAKPRKAQGHPKPNRREHRRREPTLIVVRNFQPSIIDIYGISEIHDGLKWD